MHLCDELVIFGSPVLASNR